MDQMDQMQFEAIPVNGDGFRPLPCGDYRGVDLGSAPLWLTAKAGEWELYIFERGTKFPDNSVFMGDIKFPDQCSFGEGCQFNGSFQFGRYCTFGNRAHFSGGLGVKSEFDAHCSFGADGYFRNCVFGEYAEFGGKSEFIFCEFGENVEFGRNPSFGVTPPSFGGKRACSRAPVMSLEGVAGGYPVTAYLLEDGPVFRHGINFLGNREEFQKYAARQLGVTEMLTMFTKMVDKRWAAALKRAA